VLLSWHNLAFFQTVMARAREAIVEGRYEAFRKEAVERSRDRGEAEL
jgi:queuine tRNA-ribosyltransferase